MERWGLFTDLYELTMAAAFHAEGRDETATFELFVRELPLGRPFLVVCGLGPALDRLEAFTFGPDELAYLAGLDLFDAAFLQLLAGLRFSGEVAAVAEGELVQANEPLISVTGSLIEAQLVETMLLNTIGCSTMVASKAALVAMATGGRPFVDFSARRDHGADAALLAARAAFVAGASGTSLVEAGRRYGIPLSGTMAHSYVLAHPSEHEAFVAFLTRYGQDAVLLIDTYDTERGAQAAVGAMAETGVVASGVRIDSGDLADGAKAVRGILDGAGYPQVRIVASGDLDEERIAVLVAAGAPIDAFGVGTRLGTSADAPYLGVVYKLVECKGTARGKTSPGKATLPGRKQVWRSADADLLALADEDGPEGARPLLAAVWRDGQRLGPASDLSAARARASSSLAAWTGRARPVVLSGALASLASGADPSSS